MPLLAYKCRKCEARYEVLDHGGERIGIDRDDDLPICPCGADDGIGLIDTHKRPESIEFDNSFPRYDRALGVTLESEQHRRQICKERGLVPLETRFNDVTSDYKAEKRRQAEEDRAADDYIRELNESTAPEFVGARIARDRGHLMDWNDSTDKIRRRN